MSKSTFTLDWEAHEYEHKERGADWFWMAGIVVGAVALAAIIFGNIIFAILVIVSGLSLALFINRPPENIRLSASEAGVRKDKVFYPMDSLAAFWIDLEHPHKKVILRSKKSLMPLIIVPLSDETDVESLRAGLAAYLSEEYHSLPLVEKILEYLGF